MRRLVLAATLTVAASGAALAQGYQPAYVDGTGSGLGRGAEIVLVYFGSSDCMPCQDAGFKADLERAKVRLAARAEDEGKAFAAVGVALDWDVAEGFDFLQGSGAFDEVAIGRNWENAAALAHLWRADGLDSRAIAIPSLVVFERSVTAAGPIAATEPDYRFEVAGAIGLRDWVEAGLPLD